MHVDSKGESNENSQSHHAEYPWGTDDYQRDLVLESQMENGRFARYVPMIGVNAGSSGRHVHCHSLGLGNGKHFRLQQTTE